MNNYNIKLILVIHQIEIPISLYLHQPPHDQNHNFPITITSRVLFLTKRNNITER